MAALVKVVPRKVGKIDDVQELTKGGKTEIPKRFILDMTERPMQVTIPLPLSTRLPAIIDLKKLTEGNNEEFHHEIMKLSTSCKEWGVFQVINHGIDLDLMEKMEKVATDFFKLPLEEKQKYPASHEAHQGYGQTFVVSDDQKLDWCNMFVLGLTPQSSRMPQLWPTNPPMFSDTVEAYSIEIRKLLIHLLKFIALSLGLKENVFEEMYGDERVQGVRMNYYPACPRPDLVLGISPHADGSALTVLHQGKGSPDGLQILKDNKWFLVEVVENALVINMGDTTEVWTNGRYKSPEHRAVTHKEKDRLSIATFYAPGYEKEISPMQEMVDKNNPSKYRRYNHGDYCSSYISNKLQGKKSIEYAKLPPKSLSRL